MKISWIFWWIINVFEVLSFFGFAFLLWQRSVDAAGVIQTTEVKWINIAVLGLAYLIPFLIQIVWLIINLIYSKRKQVTI